MPYRILTGQNVNIEIAVMKNVILSPYLDCKINWHKDCDTIDKFVSIYDSFSYTSDIPFLFIGEIGLKIKFEIF